MAKSPDKLWDAIQRNPHNCRFGDFEKVVEWFGFQRGGGKGSHRTYFHPGVREIVDLQPLGGEAKPYQIRQFVRLVRLHGLSGGNK